jgi:DNA polymerase-1
MEDLQKKGRDKEAKKLDTERKISKTCNFLTGYGGGALGLQNALAMQEVYLPLEECEKFLESFFDSYPSLRRYLALYKRFILDNGCAVSVFGRVRPFEDVYSDDRTIQSKALRAGCNHLIQTTASDMMLVSLIAIENIMRSEGLESLLVSTVHDSLLIDSVKEELPVIHEIVMSVLHNIPETFELMFGVKSYLNWMQLVPFAGDSDIGKNYSDLKKIPTSEVDWDEVFESFKPKK